MARKRTNSYAKTVAVDFDGTLAVTKFPTIIKPRKRTIRKVKRYAKKGYKLILWTCRTEQNLIDAVMFCAIHGLYFDAVNENLPERIEFFGGDCRKVSADIYLDDRAKKA